MVLLHSIPATDTAYIEYAPTLPLASGAVSLTLHVKTRWDTSRYMLVFETGNFVIAAPKWSNAAMTTWYVENWGDGSYHPFDIGLTGMDTTWLRLNGHTDTVGGSIERSADGLTWTTLAEFPSMAGVGAVNAYVGLRHWQDNTRNGTIETTPDNSTDVSELYAVDLTVGGTALIHEGDFPVAPSEPEPEPESEPNTEPIVPRVQGAPMPSAYNRPGVYVNEAPLKSNVAQVTGTTQVAFLGTAPRGPLSSPTYVPSWASYKAIYGEPVQDYDLGFAVYHYFTNGGAGCYVHRVLTATTTASAPATVTVPASVGNAFTLTSDILGTQANDLSVIIAAGTGAGLFNLDVYDGADLVETFADLSLATGNDRYITTILNAATGSRYVTASAVVDGATVTNGTYNLTGGVDNGATEATLPVSSNAGALFTLNARNLGAWGNTMEARITTGQVAATATRFPTFGLIITLDGQEVERWSELTVDPAGSRYVETILNNYSTYLRVTDSVAVTPSTTFAYTTGTFEFLGGSDGAAVVDADYVSAINALDVIEGDLLINAPGITAAAVINPLLAYARDRGNGFVVIDPDPDLDTVSEVINAANAFSTAPGYGAVYYPAAVMFDPTKTGPGALRLTAPGGAILGAYVRTDRQRSVAKAPAGYNTDVRGLFALHRSYTEAQVGTLYSNHVNTLRTLPGVGAVINGARTLERTAPDMYIPIRRSLNYVKARLSEITAFAVFEPNDERLWDTIRIRCGKELTDFWSRGGLKGNVPDAAFYVLCDETNNTAASIAEGIVNVEVGLALQYPAEFIVINISQWSGGANDAGAQ